MLPTLTRSTKDATPGSLQPTLLHYTKHATRSGLQPVAHPTLVP